SAQAGEGWRVPMDCGASFTPIYQLLRDAAAVPKWWDHVAAQLHLLHPHYPCGYLPSVRRARVKGERVGRPPQTQALRGIANDAVLNAELIAKHSVRQTK